MLHLVTVTVKPDCKMPILQRRFATSPVWCGILDLDTKADMMTYDQAKIQFMQRECNFQFKTTGDVRDFNEISIEVSPVGEFLPLRLSHE